MKTYVFYIDYYNKLITVNSISNLEKAEAFFKIFGYTYIGELW
jgi:hypothetical protein